MIRRFVKTAIAPLLHGFHRFSSQGRRREPIIVGYHNVVEEIDHSVASCMPSMLVSAATLERQLDWLGQRFDLLSLEEAVGGRPFGRESSRRQPAVVTFDDGYEGVYQNAFPVLKRKGIPFALFTVTDPIEDRTLLIHDRTYMMMARWFDEFRAPCIELERLMRSVEPPLRSPPRFSAQCADVLDATRALLKGFSQSAVVHLLNQMESIVGKPQSVPSGMQLLTWDMIREMHKAGVTIGSHTRTHAFLTNESKEVRLDELIGSKEILEEQLRATVDHFAYPNGDFNQEIKDAVIRAGYQYAYTICRCQDRTAPEKAISRQVLWEKSGTDFLGRFSPQILACEMYGCFDFASPCERRHS
jgi:peptidoglycan/xylan/chitin deacetylase (PgdA/CDA1 family)